MMYKKSILIFFSLFISLSFSEITLRVKNIPPQQNPEFRRKDIVWTINNVSLNSYGYRDREYDRIKKTDTYRIYTVGDSYTYGWLIDDPQYSFPKIIERKLNEQVDTDVEVINGASPGFGIREEVDRFINEGKFFYPDLVMIGINDDEVNVSSTYFPPEDVHFPTWIKNLHLYQLTLGSYFARESDKLNHEYLLNIYKDPNSKDWQNYASYLLKLKEHASKINAQVIIVLFPHIHPNQPNLSYDFYPFNERIKEFGQENNFFVIDPLDEFLKYPNKEQLVINPLDAHPTKEMNELISKEILKQINFKQYFETSQRYSPTTTSHLVTKNNLSLDKFQKINKIESSIAGFPWVYFETINENGIQTFPLQGQEYRQTRYYADSMQTAKGFTHSGLPGATITYYLKPQQKGVINIKDELYGFKVIGISSILALRVLENGTTAGDYILPKSITKGNGWTVAYDQKYDYQIYKTNLKIAARQMDINPQGQIESLSQTVKLKQNLIQPTNTVTFPLEDKAFSWIKFEDFQGGGYEYALVNNQVTPINSVTLNNKALTITFNKVFEKNSEVVFYISSKYHFSPQEIIQIEVE